MNENVSKNLIITLLVVLVVGLIVIIYTTGSPKNSLDEPINTDDGIVEESSNSGIENSEVVNNEKKPPVQKEEKTTLPVPVVTALPQVDVSEIEATPGMVIVTYTDSGFLPPVVEVTAGNSVTFINSSSKPMWVTSENHPTAKAQVYPGFGQGKSVSTGGTYTFSFTTVGVWGYKNLNSEKHLGAVSVTPQ